MQVVREVVVPYTGPRPSPARRWAPVVILGLALVMAGNVALLVLNLIERHLQQQVADGAFVSVSQIRDTLSTLGSVSDATLVVAGVTLVAMIGWEISRRPKSRLARDGEAGVEPRLRVVWPLGYWTAFITGGLAFLVSRIASSSTHTGMTRAEFVTYRTYRAGVDAALIVVDVCLIALVLRATKLQALREAATPGLPASPPAGIQSIEAQPR